jgi:hypothetical protein
MTDSPQPSRRLRTDPGTVRPEARASLRQALQAMDPADEVQPAQVVARRLEEAKARLAVLLARASATFADQAATLDAPRRAILSVPDEPDEYDPLITGQDEPRPRYTRCTMRESAFRGQTSCYRPIFGLYAPSHRMPLPAVGEWACLAPAAFLIMVWSSSWAAALLPYPDRR